MEPLFSHAPRPDGDASTEGDVPPSRVCRVVLPAPRDVVYGAFTGDVHLWWPASHTGFGEGTHAFLEDGIMGEEGPDGELQVWADVAKEVPGELLELVWKLAWRPDAPTRVRVEFADAAPTASALGDPKGTAVTLTHHGWAAGAEGRDQYKKYADWPPILGRFAAFFGQPAGSVVEG
jgi:uncharacterized protein YndB with AHSA1/START domain